MTPLTVLTLLAAYERALAARRLLARFFRNLQAMAKSELNRNQKLALTALLSEPTVKAAAESCGLAERTLFYYLADETFKAELRQRQGAILGGVTSALVGLSGGAIQTLRDLLESKTATDAVKCRAALGWLRNVRDAVELRDLADRVAALEDKLSEGKR